MATSTYSSYTTTSLRRLTHTETLPYHPSTVFSAASDVSKYSTFLPLVLSSTVTTKDAHHLPKHAKLKIGHPTLGIEEEWLCMVSCDRSTGTIIAKNKEVEGANGVFESWLMRWKIQPPPTATGAGARKTATATLELEVKFRGIMYDQMFALLQDGVAKRMMEKFMVRIAELDEIERKERLEKIKEKARAEAARKAAVAKSGQQPTKAAGKGADPPKPAAKTTEPAAKAAPKKLEVRSGVK